jgi:hypothetical protein
MEELKSKYQATLTDVKEQMRAAHHEEVNELRSQGFGENYRMKEELLTRSPTPPPTPICSVSDSR